MHIKAAADLVGLSADTIRYYEKIGLVPPITRNTSGIRDFQQKDLEALEFVKCFRSAGLSVDSLTTYMTLYGQGDKTRLERLELLQTERDKLKARLSEQKAALKRLDHKIAIYQKGLSNDAPL